MKLLLKIALIFGLILVFAACKEPKIQIQYPHTDLASEALIPKPVKTIATHSGFGLEKNTMIYVSEKDTQLVAVGHFLSHKIKDKTGLVIPVNADTDQSPHNLIYIYKSDSVNLKVPESYQLYIKEDSILINTKNASGAFRGIQTLLQLVPEMSNDTLTDYPLWVVPTGKVIDSPKFEYRGAMLDVARHFFSVEEVKKYIDLLAYYKFNALHLHLSDDQGWRLEIKSWPKLTQIGAKTEVGGGTGGYYTQGDYQDIIQYAAERFVTIIPEIDMPGHTNAASVSYPFLDGTGKPIKPYHGTRVGFSSFDTRKDTVYQFIDEVVKEIAELSPGPYFHIGGDESHSTKKSDYKYFVNKVEGIVQKHGKIMVGWDEIVDGDISSEAIAQHWRTESNALKAAENGNKIILSPAKKAYLDMKYDSLSKYGLDWAGHIPLDVAYNWDPETYIEGLSKENILGVEAPLWSETISNSAELEYLAFPRTLAYAELGWSSSENCDWEDFKIRLAQQAIFFEQMNVSYYPSPLIDWK
ncbi:family 20 glycosylhydrolase [Flagellimonas allohymeniacidonis]|uniref:beta-N-acetylhexosaminidase n=1 Tax=Flagellimonas allohymeniacidonis TaxID=2517819 RepID=A0A4Q8QFS2_9FLAO|nr:family 20 glycosylhydrolase [Allomuricauda hymeniacidonis]TAI49382.1 beta-N-acetylhexosaminidase [Allomuricauda hymeniacidonis]